MSEQRLRPHIVSVVKGERRENSLLFDKYTLAQEEYFLIRNSEPSRRNIGLDKSFNTAECLG